MRVCLCAKYVHEKDSHRTESSKLSRKRSKTCVLNLLECWLICLSSRVFVSVMFVLHFSLLKAVKCFTKAIKRSFEFFNKVLRIIVIAIYYMTFYCRITVLHEQLRVLGFADATMTALSLTTLNTTCSNFLWIFSNFLVSVRVFIQYGTIQVHSS